ncbi:hypothetical protein SYNPS1DRAFT_29740 [Syncephalis pseudoplumigaleata]|uniref:Uncharacterized protein n=1 Tax=Syncephalis pseudoplumigaleata TaxID=1712513 RepID=A0A4P9YWT2_9FUNG|nr:hypothetical protein SYNPS1DRAFT_29740 [Syncephalis pseudoplumigaleata]|eukprot:RKP24496.1 hypothetical protein SYNPS1DRAFT_29740 [Syncephalis pseudoplumigaleata]
MGGDASGALVGVVSPSCRAPPAAAVRGVDSTFKVVPLVRLVVFCAAVRRVDMVGVPVSKSSRKSASRERLPVSVGMRRAVVVLRGPLDRVDMVGVSIAAVALVRTCRRVLAVERGAVAVVSA